MNFKLSLPNDYQSEHDRKEMIMSVFLGDEDLANTNPEMAYEPISEAANKSGLKYVSDSDFGSIWSGSDAQLHECVKNLPEWAKPYASKMD